MGDEYGRDLVYDFIRESPLKMVVGIFKVVNGPPVMRILNIFYFTCVIGLYVYHAVLAIGTVWLHIELKEIIIGAFFFVWLLILCIGVLVARYTADADLQLAIGTLKSGLFTYTVHEPMMDAVVARRVAQIRRLVSAFNFSCYLGAALNSWLLPLLTYLKLDPATTDISEFPFNPYLPIPIVVPFPTHTLLTYLTTFLLETLFLFQIFALYACHLEVYMSTSIQLCAQLEALNHSVRSIESRVRDLLSLENVPEDQLYERSDFQRAMYNALRENLLHHKAILRLYSMVDPYMKLGAFVVVFGFSLLIAVETLIFLENPKENTGVIFMLVSDTAGVFIMMYSGQMVEDKSLEIGSALYSTPWPLCGKEYRTLLRMAILQSQKPILIKTSFFSIQTGLMTFTDIMSWGYKMVNVVR